MSDVRFRCIDCRHEVTEAEAERLDLHCCPNCESTGTPCHSDNDFTLKINWQEIRILTHWAMNYAKDAAMRRTVKAIGGALYAQVLPQRPDLKNTLFLFEELADVKEAFGADNVRVEGHISEPEQDLKPPESAA